MKASKPEPDIQVEYRKDLVHENDPGIVAGYANIAPIKSYYKKLSIGMVTLFPGFIFILCIVLDVRLYFMIAAVGVTLAITGIVYFAMMAIVRRMKMEPPSKTFTCARVETEMNGKDPLEIVGRAVEYIGGKVARIDSNEGIVVAKIPMSLWFGPALISARINTKNGNKSEILLSSDSIAPNARYDFGANKRNVYKLKEFLLQETSSIA